MEFQKRAHHTVFSSNGACIIFYRDSSRVSNNNAKRMRRETNLIKHSGSFEIRSSRFFIRTTFVRHTWYIFGLLHRITSLKSWNLLEWIRKSILIIPHVVASLNFIPHACRPYRCARMVVWIIFFSVIRRIFLHKKIIGRRYTIRIKQCHRPGYLSRNS